MRLKSLWPVAQPRLVRSSSISEGKKLAKYGPNLGRIFIITGTCSVSLLGLDAGGLVSAQNAIKPPSSELGQMPDKNSSLPGNIVRHRGGVGDLMTDDRKELLGGNVELGPPIPPQSEPVTNAHPDEHPEYTPNRAPDRIGYKLCVILIYHGLSVGFGVMCGYGCFTPSRYRRLNSLPNVKEHATPLAGAGVERGEEVHVTGKVENRAASGVAAPRLVSLLFI